MAQKPHIIIAVDGYSSCGKSTFARLIAKELYYVYIDSGAMYRTVALFCLQKGLLSDGAVEKNKLLPLLNDIHIRFKGAPDSGFQETWLNGSNVEEEIRGIEVSSIVSKVSQIKEVRSRMVNMQRDIGRNGGVVMDGRDIGTVVFPQAEIKIFMTADVEVRAERRFKELMAKGMQVTLPDIAANIRMRDYEDENRQESPLKKAEDALILDNSHMTIEQQMDWFRSVWNNHSSHHAH